MALFATGWVTYPMTIPKALANAVADDPTYFLLVVHSPEFLPLPLSSSLSVAAPLGLLLLKKGSVCCSPPERCLIKSVFVEDLI